MWQSLALYIFAICSFASLAYLSAGKVFLHGLSAISGVERMELSVA